MNQKIGTLAVVAGILLSAAVLTTPSLKVANAQDNQTAEMNRTQRTQGLPIDMWIKVLKDKNPDLANVEQSPK
jgi:hypothetical protein